MASTSILDSIEHYGFIDKGNSAPKNFPIATLKIEKATVILEKDGEGNFTNSKGAKIGSSHLVYGYEDGYFQITDRLYIKEADFIKVHLGKIEILDTDIAVYDRNGRYLRSLKKGQHLKVYSYDSQKYDIGEGEFVQVQEKVHFIYGLLMDKENGSASINPNPLFPIENSVKIKSINRTHFLLTNGETIPLKEFSNYRFIKC